MANTFSNDFEDNICFQSVIEPGGVNADRPPHTLTTSVCSQVINTNEQISVNTSTILIQQNVQNWSSFFGPTKTKRG